MSTLRIDQQQTIFEDIISYQTNDTLTTTAHDAMLKLCVINAKQTAKAILKGRLGRFYAGVGDGYCHIRAVAFALFTQDSTLIQEAEHVKEKALELEHKLDRKQRLKASELSISDRMAMMMRAHLLCKGKFSRPDGDDVSAGTDADILCARLSPTLERSLAAGIISIARERLSLQAVAFIQQQGRVLGLTRLDNSHIRTVTRGKVSFPILPLFYTLKAVLEVIVQERLPILVVEFGKPEKQRIELFYRSPVEGELPVLLTEEEVMTLKQKEANVIVLEGRFPEGTIREDIVPFIAQQPEGILTMIKENGAYHPQFLKGTSEDAAFLDEDAQKEIALCKTAEKPYFYMVLAYANKVSLPKIRP